ncbi:LCP family protein [Xylanimonas sp. McL0601]|uniref:LCP family protein n=1 Tax=Xylanimonas sp. McL0601 TaxID=3414739 RepID=UPI003CE6FDED
MTTAPMPGAGQGPLPGPGTPEAPARTRRRMSGKAKALTAVGVLVALLLGGGLGAVLLFQHNLDRNIERLGDPFADLPERPDPAPAAGANGPVNFLVVGSDSRINANDPTQWAYGAQRTDTIMLVHLPGDRQAAQVISLPRDLWVPIPGHGESKINAAFSWGGPPLLIQTVEQLTGIRIDHFLVTSFESFAEMTDTLGGVEITVAHDVHDRAQGFQPAGTHLMTGEEALRYVRTRYGLPHGDFDRVQRQQNWMRAIMKDVAQNRTDVRTVTDFLTTVSRSVAADDALTAGRMRELFTSTIGLGPGDVTFLTAPHAGTGRSPDGRQSIVVLDRQRLDPLMAAIAADDATAYVAEHAEELKILGHTVR